MMVFNHNALNGERRTCLNSTTFSLSHRKLNPLARHGFVFQGRLVSMSSMPSANYNSNCTRVRLTVSAQTDWQSKELNLHNRRGITLPQMLNYENNQWLQCSGIMRTTCAEMTWTLMVIATVSSICSSVNGSNGLALTDEVLRSANDLWIQQWAHAFGLKYLDHTVGLQHISWVAVCDELSIVELHWQSVGQWLVSTFQKVSQNAYVSVWKLSATSWQPTFQNNCGL